VTRYIAQEICFSRWNQEIKLACHQQRVHISGQSRTLTSFIYLLAQPVGVVHQIAIKPIDLPFNDGLETLELG
jgi:hypothetical protein